MKNKTQGSNEINKKVLFILMICILLLAVTVCIIISKQKSKKDDTNPSNSSHVSIDNTATKQSDLLIYKPDADSIAIDDNTGIMYVNNVIILFFQPGTKTKKVQDIVQSVNGTIVGSVPVIDQYQVLVETHTLDELVQICDDVKQNDCVFEAIYDQVHAVTTDMFIPDDDWDGNTDWSEENPEGLNWWPEAIDALTAWEYREEYHNIRIGIIDNGFDVEHEDLSGKFSYCSPENNAENHGTHVAGIIGAKANNHIGITGIVWKSDLYAYDWEYASKDLSVFDLLMEEIEDSYRGDIKLVNDTTILAATAVLVEKGVKVLNYSLGDSTEMKGTQRNETEVYDSGRHASVYIQALLNRGYDFLIVQSSGNGNKEKISVDTINNGFFASIYQENCVESENIKFRDIINRIIIVGAAQLDGKNGYIQAEWSNAGSRVDICAPGCDIYSTVSDKKKYDKYSGTSMSAPIVTSVAALVWSANENLTASEVKRIICDPKNTKYEVKDNTSRKHPLDYSYRMVNAALSVEAALAWDSKKVIIKYPEDAVEFNGHHYYVYNDEYADSYADALEYCESMGGHLATITSKEENDFLYQYVCQKGFRNVYFGLSDLKTEGQWLWCTGESVSYTNWGFREPNSENPDEDYAQFYFKYKDGTWNDGDFGRKTVSDGKAFLCEWDD